MKRFLMIILLSLSGLYALAAPARSGVILLTQPDGSRFPALLFGDEFMKIRMTESGESIIQDPDGWWCYASYQADGTKVSTGCRVGTPVSSDLLVSSRNIPFDVLTDRARHRRIQAERARIRRLGERMRLNASGSEQKDKAGLVILAQFAGEEEKFKNSREKFVAMLTQEGYSVNGATGSAKEYFDDQFRGRYQFSFDVTEVVTVSQKRSYYGGNDSAGDDLRPHKMVMEACVLADASVDFAKYDQDSDGEVDNVFVFFAGLDEASGAAEEHIWSHAWYIKDGAGENLRLDDVVINRYACAAELEGSSYYDAYMTGIGTFCHEYSHTLGLPDFYDADYNEGGFSASLWQSTSLMDGGNYNNDCNTPPYYNAVEREILGLSAPIVIESPGTYQLSPVNDGQYYRINTSTENEYFLIEYRDGKGWDEHIGGSGVLVYHVDKSDSDTGYSELWDRNITAADRWLSQVEINSLSSRQCADLIEADGRKDAYATYMDVNYRNLLKSLSGVFFPYGKSSSLTPFTDPALKCWDDTEVNLALTDISVRDGKASFNVVEFSGKEMPVPVNVRKDVFQDCAIISFESSFEYSGKAKISYGPSGGEMETMIIESYEQGKWAFELPGLSPMTSYSVQMSFSEGGSSGEPLQTSFMTKKLPEDGFAYIYLGEEERNDDGTFKEGAVLPLKVMNAPQVKSVKWTFNGSVVTVGDDMYYHIPSSGTLKAFIERNDGDDEVIIKNVRISNR